MTMPASAMRRCSRTACAQPAVTTLTYVYADQTAVVGPLALFSEPHAYDLCAAHSERLSAPRGWEIVRLAYETAYEPSNDDLLALADAVREAAAPKPHPVADAAVPYGQEGAREVGRRGHLRVLKSDD